jgi:hypothetical protein
MSTACLPIGAPKEVSHPEFDGRLLARSRVQLDGTLMLMRSDTLVQNFPTLLEGKLPRPAVHDNPFS